MLQHKIGFLGAGQMATAFAQGFVNTGLTTANMILASAPTEATRAQFSSKLQGAKVCAENAEVVRNAQIIILAVKPYKLKEVLVSLRPTLTKSQLVLSLVAGIPLATLSAELPKETPVVRVMPNTPCLIGQGVSAYTLGKYCGETDRQLVHQILSTVGSAYEVTEPELDAVTGLSGSGPAYVYTILESLAEGGVQMGLSTELAAKLAAETVAGAAGMVISTQKSPAELRDQVTSPGGTTVAGLAALEKAGIRAALHGAVQAATLRSRELGKNK